jgi:hypothetical protein
MQGKITTSERGNMSFKRMEQFKYLGTTLTNQNSIHQDILLEKKTHFVWQEMRYIKKFYLAEMCRH